MKREHLETKEMLVIRESQARKDQQENQERQEIKGQRVGVANLDPRAQLESLAQEACKETEGYLDCLGHRDDQAEHPQMNTSSRSA